MIAFELGMERSQTPNSPSQAQYLESQISEELFSAEDIRAEVERIGSALAERYRDKLPLVIGVLTGSFVFAADLVRAMPIVTEIDFIAVSSYGDNTESSGVVRIVKDLERSIEGRHIVLVEDIVDSGLTLRYLVDHLLRRKPASLVLCALLDKRNARKIEIQLDYSGFPCPDKFVVGYGLDYGGHYRNLPNIVALKSEALRESNGA